VSAAQSGPIIGEPADLAIVARSRGGIKRRKYELRFSYYLSFGFRFGFLLRFLRGLLGNGGREPGESMPEQSTFRADQDRRAGSTTDRR
jgi:hypothetical protein